MASFFERLLIRIFIAFLRLLEFITEPIYKYFHESTKLCVSRIDEKLLLKPAVELACLIRHKQIKSVDVVRLYIERIKNVNDLINAVVKNRFEEAIDEARKVDELVASKEFDKTWYETNKPFLGVPISVKEAFGLKGFPNSGGCWYQKNKIASQDADVVAKMRNAGAIPICLTNCSEGCMWMESNNGIYGRSRNPYHSGRHVGGSSGGEGAIIGAGASVIGLGSDIGGSIRMPCFFNGIFGHKCSTGTISNKGQFPVPAHSEAESFLSSGPMCRYASDLFPMFKVLADANYKLNLEKPVNIKQLKFFYMEDDGGSLVCSPVHYQIKLAVLRAANHFACNFGCSVTKVSLSELRKAFGIWSTMMNSSGEMRFAELIGKDFQPIRPLWEILQWICGARRHTLPGLGLSLLEHFKVPPSEVERMKRSCNSLKQKFNDMLGEDGIFIYPSHPKPAQYHGQPLLTFFNPGYTGIFNVLGLPVTQVPMGLCDDGVPIGIQVVGNHYMDRLTITVAQELEVAFGGWVPPGA